MPPTKIRGILREYLQILILREIYRTESGRNLYFTGGTYLRLVHNSKRFSEDLDFNSNKITKGEFENLLKKIEDELKRIGLKSQAKFAHWGNVYVAKFIFPEIEKVYNVISKYSKKEGIMIKVETNKPKWKIENETQVISGFGKFYPCICTEKSILFADKIDALIKKNRGRHIYDILFMLSNRYSVNKNILRALGIKKDPLEVISERIKKLSKEELKKQAEILRPFLFDESEANLLVNAHNIILPLVEQYKNSVREWHLRPFVDTQGDTL
ncbi:MAG: nucleotidyl transferase AbiEii/AbiGii toxin family protein [Candidatus Omnitrophica bacterium]|nr:nucleotidyl transferase AbiEii/AbiGii toxin family protein [Candidatus Omnitrophota bacterium]